MPNATTVSHNAAWPSAITALQSSPSGGRVTERIRRAVAAFEPDLVGAVLRAEIDVEVRIERHASVVTDVAHHLHRGHAVRIELRIPAAVQRVREVNALAVTTDLGHLRTSTERPATR